MLPFLKIFWCVYISNKYKEKLEIFKSIEITIIKSNGTRVVPTPADILVDILIPMRTEL